MMAHGAGRHVDRPDPRPSLRAAGEAIQSRLAALDCTFPEHLPMMVFIATDGRVGRRDRFWMEREFASNLDPSSRPLRS